MTVLERCHSLRAEIDRYTHLARAESEATVFRERATELRATYEAIGTALHKRRILVANAASVPALPGPSRPLVLIQEYRDAVVTSPQDAGKVYGQLKRSINKFSADVTGTIAVAIDTLKTQLPSVEEPFLKAVERIPGYAEKVARIRTQRDRLAGGRVSVEMAPDDIAKFLDARTQLRTLAGELQPAEFPAEVLAFFQAVRRDRGAPVDQLTEAVRHWLVEHDLLKNVRVTLV
ncbi:MAG: hypothetical protein QOI24_1257 [Acidobacteriota bacterium]|jgi:hypothetical protein|nr:hypothetical protein [Acidobacteriota bacterium]